MRINGSGGVSGLGRAVSGGRAVTCWLLLFLAGLWLVPATAAAFWPFSRSASVDEAQPVVAPRAESVPVAQLDGTSLLYRQIGRLGTELLASMAEPDPEFSALQGGVIVLSFVDQKKLTRTTSFGRHLAEQLMNELQQRRVPVVELRQSREVRVQAQRGEYGLSRDPAELRDQVQAAAMLTGTYTATAEQVIVNARIIDNRTARLLAAATAVVQRTPVVNALLADPVSGAPPVEAEPMYMKRLEF